MTDTLVTFLEVRLTEDEGMAREATPGPWYCYPLSGDSSEATVGTVKKIGTTSYPDPESVVTALQHYAESEDSYDTVEGAVSRVDAQHIARWDPARVLAGCEVTRQLMASHRPSIGLLGQLVCSGCGDGDDYIDWPCPRARILVLQWASHPDYRPEWSPKEV